MRSPVHWSTRRTECPGSSSQGRQTSALRVRPGRPRPQGSARRAGTAALRASAMLEMKEPSRRLVEAPLWPTATHAPPAQPASSRACSPTRRAATALHPPTRPPRARSYAATATQARSAHPDHQTRAHVKPVARVLSLTSQILPVPPTLLVSLVARESTRSSPPPPAHSARQAQSRSWRGPTPASTAKLAHTLPLTIRCVLRVSSAHSVKAWPGRATLVP